MDRSIEMQLRSAAALAALMQEIVDQAPRGTHLAVGSYGNSSLRNEIETHLRMLDCDFEAVVVGIRPHLAAVVRATRALVAAAAMHGGMIGYAGRDKYHLTRPGPIVRALQQALDAHFRTYSSDARDTLSVAA